MDWEILIIGFGLIFTGAIMGYPLGALVERRYQIKRLLRGENVNFREDPVLNSRIVGSREARDGR